MAAERTSPPQEQTSSFHGGRLVARRLKAHGVSRLFTLSGGHLFSIYDGCRAEGIEIVDVRHEQTAAFAAEGWAKVTREVGVCALTAGPGVTNGISAIASAQANHSPIVVLGGRAPAGRWGQGSLQEIDHVPFVATAEQAGGDGGERGGDPRAGGGRVRGGTRPTRRPGVRGSADGLRVHGGRGARRPAGGRPGHEGSAGGGGRGGGKAAGGRRTPGDHGGHRPLLGPRRGGAAGTGGGIVYPGVPQRPRTGVRGGRSRAVLLAHAQPRPAGGGRGAGGRGADGLPAGLRGRVWGGDGDRGDRRGGAPAPAPAGTGGGAVWVAERDAERPAPGGERARQRAATGGGRPTPRLGRATARQRRRSCARASGRSCRTRGRRCIRCACTASWRRCWIATRS